MIADLQRNFDALLNSVDDCLAKRRILPCLMLLYSGIDVVASLEHPKSTRSTFINWVNKYMLRTKSLPCKGVDLYGARCGVLHTLSAESDLSRQGKAHRIMYAWGNAKAEDLAESVRLVGRKGSDAEALMSEGGFP